MATHPVQLSRSSPFSQWFEALTPPDGQDAWQQIPLEPAQAYVPVRSGMTPGEDQRRLAKCESATASWLASSLPVAFNLRAYAESALQDMGLRPNAMLRASIKVCEYDSCLQLQAGWEKFKMMFPGVQERLILLDGSMARSLSLSTMQYFNGVEASAAPADGEPWGMTAWMNCMRIHMSPDDRLVVQRMEDARVQITQGYQRLIDRFRASHRMPAWLTVSGQDRRSLSPLETTAPMMRMGAIVVGKSHCFSMRTERILGYDMPVFDPRNPLLQGDDVLEKIQAQRDSAGRRIFYLDDNGHLRMGRDCRRVVIAPFKVQDESTGRVEDGPYRYTYSSFQRHPYRDQTFSHLNKHLIFLDDDNGGFRLTRFSRENSTLPVHSAFEECSIDGSSTFLRFRMDLRKMDECGQAWMDRTLVSLRNEYRQCLAIRDQEGAPNANHFYFPQHPDYRKSVGMRIIGYRHPSTGELSMIPVNIQGAPLKMVASSNKYLQSRVCFSSEGEGWKMHQFDNDAYRRITAVPGLHFRLNFVGKSENIDSLWPRPLAANSLVPRQRALAGPAAAGGAQTAPPATATVAAPTIQAIATQPQVYDPGYWRALQQAAAVLLGPEGQHLLFRHGAARAEYLRQQMEHHQAQYNRQTEP